MLDVTVKRALQMRGDGGENRSVSYIEVWKDNSDICEEADEEEMELTKRKRN